jgi:hypothetical protein
LPTLRTLRERSLIVTTWSGWCQDATPSGGTRPAVRLMKRQRSAAR